MENKSCPKCGAAFVCMHNDIAACQCASVKLSEASRAYIKKTYNNCLCVHCLREINEEVNSGELY